MFLNATTSVGDKIALGSLTALIGIVVVFLMLMILVVVVSYLPKINIDLKKSKDNKNEANLENVVQDEKTVVLNDENNEELIAVITAAISVILSSETKSKNISRAPFVVKSINRI